MPDVDIDFFDRDGTLKLFKHTPASMIKEARQRNTRRESISMLYQNTRSPDMPRWITRKQKTGVTSRSTALM